jgi:hypothetical protein
VTPGNGYYLELPATYVRYAGFARSSHDVVTKYRTSGGEVHESTPPTLKWGILKQGGLVRQLPAGSTLHGSGLPHSGPCSWRNTRLNAKCTMCEAWYISVLAPACC